MFTTIENKILVNIMKDIFDEKKLFKNLKTYFEIGNMYYKTESGLKFIESVIYYLFHTVDENKKDDLFKIIDNTLQQGGNYMTIAMKLKEEGKIEGKIEGRIKTAKRMKDLGFDFKVISEVTGLTIEEIEKL